MRTFVPCTTIPSDNSICSNFEFENHPWLVHVARLVKKRDVIHLGFATASLPS